MLKSRDYSFDNKCLYLTSCSTYSHVRTEEDNVISVKNEIRDYTEGLCANCIKSNACAVTRVEGGIWRCSDYIEND